MPHIPFHPAPGLGDLMPGSFVVPQNPLRGDDTELVPSVQAANGGRIAYRPKMGDLLPGSFVVPQNPLRAALSGLGCGCNSGCNAGAASNGRQWDGGFHSSGLQGMGAIDTQEIGTWLQEPQVAGVPGWGIVAGAVLAYILFAPGGPEYRAARRDLDSKYRGYRRGAARLA